MQEISNHINLLDVTAGNVAELGIYCIKDKKSPGYLAKLEWFKAELKNGLRIKIAVDSKGKQLGFIEYIPAEAAWRPVKAENYLFIQCIGLFVKEARGKGIAGLLLSQCEEDALKNNKSGICAMSSEGAWIANKSLYLKNGFEQSAKLDRFELMYKSIDNRQSKPEFIDWRSQQLHYQGWHLLYADQCPWHEKSVTDLQQSARNKGIVLNVWKLSTAKEAQSAPSGFGSYSLIKDGKLLADHYISRTRFENILKQEKGK